MSSGGARQGAGRKAMLPQDKRVQLAVYLKPDLVEALKRECREGETISRVIERLCSCVIEK